MQELRILPLPAGILYWERQHIVSFAAGLYQVRNEKFHHERFIVERLVLFVEEKDVQTITPPTGTTGQRAHGNGHLGHVAIGWNSDQCSLYDVGIILVESGTHLDQDFITVDEGTETRRLGASLRIGWKYWLISPHYMHTDGVFLIWLYT